MSKHIVSLVYRKKIGSMMRKAVFSYMADRANDDGTGIWSSKGTIANEIEASRQGVINTIKGLVEDGLLIEVGPRKCANGHTMEYSIDLKKVHELPFVTGKKDDMSKSGRVNEVDGDPSTECTSPVNLVDTNHPEPPKEPSINVENLLDEIWKVWSDAGRKRSHSREQLLKKLKTKTKGKDLREVLKAFKVMAKTTDGNFHPGIQVVLNSGQWQNWIGKDQSLEQPKSLDDWKQAASDYCELSVWPADLGPAPHQPGCEAPVGLLKTIANRMKGHSWHQSIVRNIGEAA